MSVCLSVCLSVSLSVCLSIYLSIYQLQLVNYLCDYNSECKNYGVSSFESYFVCGTSVILCLLVL